VGILINVCVLVFYKVLTREVNFFAVLCPAFTIEYVQHSAKTHWTQ